MLYTFSQAQYDLNELRAILTQIQATDAVVLWQDGVLQAVKNPQFFPPNQTFVLAQDLTARGLSSDLPTISIKQLVALTEHYFPQLAF